MSACVDPDAPIERCIVCRGPVHTCERSEPVNNNYCCPEHPHGYEVGINKWVCSDKCGEELDRQCDEMDRCSSYRWGCAPIVELLLMVLMLGLVAWALSCSFAPGQK